MLNSINDDVILDDENKIVKTLTRSQMSIWPEEELQSSSLSSLYAVLHKVAMANWVPSTNNSIVTKAQGFLMYRVGENIHFDFIQHVFSLIGTYAELNSKFGGLPFPYMIYSILTSQGLKKKAREEFTDPPHPLSISPYFLQGERKIDLS